jgi:uncharacterized protein YndB with AHSA1/START domain
MSHPQQAPAAAGSVNDSFATLAGPAAIRFERLLPGPIERVWAFITESDKRAQWLGAGVMPQQEGAQFEIFFHHQTLSSNVAPVPERFKSMENGVSSPHKVLRCEPPRLLKITWGNPAQPSEVTFDLSEEGSKVRLILTHALIASRSDMNKTSGGWHAHLSMLIDKLEGRMPPSFWTLFEVLEPQYERHYPQDVGTKA